MRNRKGYAMTMIIITSSMLLLTGCGSKDKPANIEYTETEADTTEEIDLTKLLSVINDSVTEHCGEEYTLTPFAQYKRSDGSLTDDLSEINKEGLKNNKLTAYVLFQVPQKGDKLEDMASQHYIEAVVDISSYEVLSLSESDGSIEDGSWTNIF